MDRFQQSIYQYYDKSFSISQYLFVSKDHGNQYYVQFVISSSVSYKLKEQVIFLIKDDIKKAGKIFTKVTSCTKSSWGKLCG